MKNPKQLAIAILAYTVIVSGLAGLIAINIPKSKKSVEFAQVCEHCHCGLVRSTCHSYCDGKKICQMACQDYCQEHEGARCPYH